MKEKEKREVITKVDRPYIDAIVEKCLQGNASIVIYDDAANNARIERGRYIVGRPFTKSEEHLKEIFYKLIMKHKSFVYDGTHFRYYQGKWRIDS